MSFKYSAILFFLCLLTLPLHLSAQTQDSRAGDEAALEALYVAANGSGWDNNRGWSSSGMSLDDDIYGVEVATIDGELRVAAIDLKNNGLTGDIEVPELGNLKENELFSVYLNDLNSQIPSELFTPHLRYLYLCLSDNVQDNLDTEMPHEAVFSGLSHNHVGKTKGSENNVFHGVIPDNIDDSPLEWVFISWTDYWAEGDKSINGAPTTVNGITSIPASLWNITTLNAVQIYENWNITGSGNTFSFPEAIGHIPNLTRIKLGGGSGTDWDENAQGFMVGGYPSDMGKLALTALDLARNGQLSGFPDLSGSGATLEQISLRFSDFASDGGSPPEWLYDGTLAEMDDLDLAFPKGKGFTGPFTGEFGTMNKMSKIDFGRHDIPGELPASFWKSSTTLKKNDFSGNRLTSLGTDDLTNIAMPNHLEHLRFRDNEISQRWPNLDWSNPPPLYMVFFADNRFVFSDMLYVPSNAPAGETIFELYQSLGLDYFDYSPQKPFGRPATRSYATGSVITIDDFSTVVTHADNQYQWQKDGSDISRATDRSLTITDAQSADEGTYRLVVTNPGIPDLTLTSEPITIKISGNSSSNSSTNNP